MPHGLYHCVNSGHGTWAEVVAVLAKALGVDAATAVEAVPLASVSFAVPRPKFSALSNAALAAHGVTLPHWRDAVGRYAAALPPSCPA